MTTSILPIEENEQETSIEIGDRIKASANGYPDGLQYLANDLWANRRDNDEGRVFGFYCMPRNNFVGIVRDDGTCAAYTYAEVHA